jgi:phosphatidylserine/phosphatidylglycerophosphate/cardiolipin synthase-like enzyme
LTQNFTLIFYLFNMELIVGNKFSEKVVPYIDAAVKTIEIIIFDWRWYPETQDDTVRLFNMAIIRAKNRGVSIRVICNNDHVLDALKKNNIRCKRLYTYKMVHAKMLLIDEAILVIGSHNYTQSAFKLNLEISAKVELERGQNEAITFFNTLWG